MYDKSKKTWSQRLKITKSEKTHSATAAEASTCSSASPTADADYAHSLAMQRLQQQLLDYHHGVVGGTGVIGYEYLPAEYLSLKYAEPSWIYGTVRGVPTRPGYHHYHNHHLYAHAPPSYAHPHAAAIFAPTAHPLGGPATEALAVVICSCPEYFSGTKRDVKKASVCKKCRGSRLPLASIGGTMRLPGSSGGGGGGGGLMVPSSKMRARGAAATMRIVSTTKKARPSILDPQKDPYDLMRRTRLLSPEPGDDVGGGGNTSKDKQRSRGKNASPNRGRSRIRALLPPLPEPLSSVKAMPAQPLPSKTDLHDCWLVEDVDVDALLLDDNGGHERRSILGCSVNPYDLISIKSLPASSPQAPMTAHAMAADHVSSSSYASSALKLTQSTTPQQSRGKTPIGTTLNDDDFNVEDAALNEEAPPFATSSTPSSMPTKGGEEIVNSNYTHNVQAIAGKRISLGEHTKTKKSLLIQQSQDGHGYENIVIGGDEDDVKATIQSQPLPLPSTLTTMLPASPSVAKELRTHTRAAPPPPTAQQQPQPKRPARAKRSEAGMAPPSVPEGRPTLQQLAPVNYEGGCEDHEIAAAVVLTVTPTQHIKSILKRPTSQTKAVSDEPPSSETLQATRSSASKPSSPRTSTTSNNAALALATLELTTATTNGSSQFYIPMPQARKKVQFMVIECAIGEAGKAAYDSDTLGAGKTEMEVIPPSSAAATYEYYNRKRDEQKMQRQQHTQSLQQQELRKQPIAAQAALLAALHHDSDLVSCALNAMNAATKGRECDSDASFASTATAMTTKTKAAADIALHYEDVAIDVLREQQQLEHQHHSQNNENNDKCHTDSTASTMTAATIARQEPSMKAAATITTTTRAFDFAEDANGDEVHNDAAAQHESHGGVAIYQNKDDSVISSQMEVIMNNIRNLNVRSTSVADLCAVECKLDNGNSLIMAIIYVSPSQKIIDIQEFIHRALLEYSKDVLETIARYNKKLHGFPFILAGDFNIHFSHKSSEILISELRSKRACYNTP